MVQALCDLWLQEHRKISQLTLTEKRYATMDTHNKLPKDIENVKTKSFKLSEAEELPNIEIQNNTCVEWLNEI